jgi:hypothetical protein
MTKSPHFENVSDQGHKKLFSEQAAAGARDPFRGTPEERANQHNAEVQKQDEDDAVRNADPVPTGEGDDIHKDDPTLPRETAKDAGPKDDAAEG